MTLTIEHVIGSWAYHGTCLTDQSILTNILHLSPFGLTFGKEFMEKK